jgi:lipopolysaccharide transport system ATP-binding protein
MSNTVIKVENVGKLYRLGEIGTGTISHDLNRWWARVRGKEDPFAKVGEANDRTQKGNSDYVWALKDVNFEVKQGEVLGIIGRNGAGKSTLLKILSKVTTPSRGSIKVKGRIASLLEVGTGFHPELTGRENVYLNGAILGMTKLEIQSKFDEILDFSGVERYIDTPVKRYSSGMYVRLAFAVAAFLEPEILIVDEVLAVGDAEFQKKCLGRIKDVSVNEGRTVLFVSHQMGSVVQLCTSCVLLKHGTIEAQGSPIDIIDKYYRQLSNFDEYKNSTSQSDIFIKEVFTCNSEGEHIGNFAHSEEIHLRIKIGVNKFDTIQNIGIALLTKDKKRVFTVNRSFKDFYSGNNETIVDFILDGGIIAPMDYSFLIALNTRTGLVTYDWKEDICPIKIFDDGTEFAFAEGLDYGCIILKDKWNIIQ